MAVFRSCRATTWQGFSRRDLLTFKVLEIGWFSDIALHPSVFITGCLPASSAESGMHSVAVGTGGFGKGRAGEGGSLFQSPSALGVSVHSPKERSASAPRVINGPSPGPWQREGGGTICSVPFHLYFPVSWCYNPQKRREKHSLPVVSRGHKVTKTPVLSEVVICGMIHFFCLNSNHKIIIYNSGNSDDMIMVIYWEVSF